MNDLRLVFGGNKNTNELKWQYSEHFDGKKGKRKANNYCNKEPIKGNDQGILYKSYFAVSMTDFNISRGKIPSTGMKTGKHFTAFPDFCAL